ncbi:hypothetical protein BGW80DRAFT_1460528 [Lactifluus volemus]|nr:hypothetical protein BGW80DRAFT_1460528 [Lactifluus volemus]
MVVVRVQGPPETLDSDPLDRALTWGPPGPDRASRAWSKLVHVCQRWRYTVFSSPLRLNLRLLCTEWTPARKILDIWPPLPIEIRSSFVSSRVQVEDNIIAALEHPNRIRSISLGNIATPLESLVAVMQEPFPAMESLFLQISGPDGTVLALPSTFLGGSAPRIRSLHLDGIPIPTLPRLLLSSNDLVDLHLERIPHIGYISPEAMATCVSALTSLTKLSIEFISPASRPDPITRHPPPLTRTVLPALTNFDFHGVSEYLEDLVAQIDAPLLRAVRITFFNQLVFDTQQLPRFIDHAPALKRNDTASIAIFTGSVLMRFSSMTPLGPDINNFLIIKISCKGVDWQVSSVAQICNQLSESFISGIERLFIHDIPSVMTLLQDVTDETEWLELFHPFIAVRTLYILSQRMESYVVSALQRRSTEVLPALDELCLKEYQASGPAAASEQQDIVIARQGSAHAVAVHRLKTQKK